jgi:hypothetical protein
MLVMLNLDLHAAVPSSLEFYTLSWGQTEVSFRAQGILFYFDLVGRPTECLQRNPVCAGVFLVAWPDKGG